MKVDDVSKGKLGIDRLKLPNMLATSQSPINQPTVSVRPGFSDFVLYHYHSHIDIILPSPAASRNAELASFLPDNPQ